MFGKPMPVRYRKIKAMYHAVFVFPNVLKSSIKKAFESLQRLKIIFFENNRIY